MSRSIRYGLDSAFDFDVEESSVLNDCAAGASSPLEDLAAVVAVAMDEPLDFPPLRQAVVEGDRVAIALSAGVPQADLLVGGVIDSLSQTGVELDAIQLVVSDQLSAKSLAEIQQQLPVGIDIVVHDPDEAQGLAFLTSSRQGNAIYVNRALHEADVVLPIGSVRLDAERGVFEIESNLFPAFSDAATIARFAGAHAGLHETLQEEIAEAIWLLGVHLMVQVVPGPGGTVLHVLVGESSSIAEKSQALCNAAWRINLPDRASLVIASLQGGAEEQTWRNFSRALRSASRAVSENGAIVLCTEIRRGELNVAMDNPLVEPASDVMAPSKVARDAPPISIIDQVRERHSVYLLSNLDEEYVEDLGLGFVAQAEQISRLARQHPSCILLNNAQHVYVDCAGGE